MVPHQFEIMGYLLNRQIHKFSVLEGLVLPGRSFVVDDKVRITGLKKQAQYNGKVGVVIGFCGEKQRVKVELINEGVLKLKPSNLILTE